MEVLREIFGEDKDLFPSKIKEESNLRKWYHVFCSLRQSSDTRALKEKEILSTDIDLVNRWLTVENARGKRPNLKMKHRYCEFALIERPSYYCHTK